MKQQIRIFFTALMFFTRIPCPKGIDFSQEYLTKSSRYFPLVGIVVGSMGAALYWLCQFVFPQAIAILLSMIATILITGAFHEDGLGDMCDGFGGGWNKKDILRIMKDSRTGTYGVVGICFVLALKFACLYSMPSSLIPYVLISGHALSRYAAATLLFTLDYVREDEDSKSKPAAQRMSLTSFVIATVFGIMPLLLFKSYIVVITLVPVFAIRWYLGGYYKKWIGGQTGDCAGATQQICEVIFYLSLIILWKFI